MRGEGRTLLSAARTGFVLSLIHIFMYMLRTEIRKLGGLICFLFVMLAIQAQQYTVTGGSGVPYLLENPGNRIRAVSYTHLDVYKRQVNGFILLCY